MTKLNQPMTGNTFILWQPNCVWRIGLYGLSKTFTSREIEKRCLKQDRIEGNGRINKQEALGLRASIVYLNTEHLAYGFEIDSLHFVSSKMKKILQNNILKYHTINKNKANFAEYFC